MRYSICFLMAVLLVPAMATAEGKYRDWPVESVIADHPLAEGTRVRVKYDHGYRNYVTGQVLSDDLQTLELVTDDGTLTIDYENISSLEIESGRGNLALPGAFTGGLIGAVVGYGVANSLSGDGFFEDSDSDVTQATVVGGLLGMGIGAAIGYAIPKTNWKEVERVSLGYSFDGAGGGGLTVTLAF